MTGEQETLKEIRNEIAKLPPEVVQEVAKIADALRELVKRHGGVAISALALVGAELAALNNENE